MDNNTKFYEMPNTTIDILKITFSKHAVST